MKKLNTTVLLKLAFLFLVSISFLQVSGNTIVENKGQIKNTEVLYYSAGNDWKIYFLKDRISFVKTVITKKANRNEDQAQTLRWDMVPEWKNPLIKMEGLQNEMINFIYPHLKIQVPAYSKLVYKSYEFDIVFYSTEKNGLKYDIVYHPTEDAGVKNIRFKIEGATQIEKGKEDISIETLLGNFNIEIPLSFTDIKIGNELTRKKVNVNTHISDDIIDYSFSYENDFTEVIIDPWASFAGGADLDEAYGSAFDSNGNIFISGYSSSTDFPVTTGVVQTVFNGIYDSFVFKFNSAGARVWATYYGGNNNDFGNRMIIDENDQPILTGYTYSSDLSVSPSGVFSSVFQGVFDAFLLRLKTDGTFDWATFYGGTGGEFVTDMDYQNGELVFGGFTSSMDLPVIPTAWQPSLAGALDIFVAKFDTTGNRIWDTYYGGINSEDSHTLTFDPMGNIIIAGDTYSTDFPVSTGAYQNTYTAGSDICMVKFDNNGQMLWSTYFGSNVNEDCEAIDTDEFGNIYIAGYASGNGLPITNGLFQDTHSGDRDMIFGSFSPNGNLLWLTFAGGTAWDLPKDIDVNEGGIISIIGETYSTDFPETGNVFQTGNNGTVDAFYLISDSTGNVSLSTLYGGSGSDSGQSISFDELSRTILAGYSSSADLDVSIDVFQEINNGQEDAFVKTVDSTAGVFNYIEENTQSQNLLLYPNPTNGEIILLDLIPAEYELLIHDLNGKLILQRKVAVTDQYRLRDFHDFSNGIYTLQLWNDSNSYLQKIIKL